MISMRYDMKYESFFGLYIVMCVYMISLSLPLSFPLFSQSWPTLFSTRYTHYMCMVKRKANIYEVYTLQKPSHSSTLYNILIKSAHKAHAHTEPPSLGIVNRVMRTCIVIFIAPVSSTKSRTKSLVMTIQ